MAITKYQPLRDYLAAHRAHTRIAMTFAEVIAVLGQQLPASAYKFREWWANQSDTTKRPQAAAWLNAGFVVDGLQQGANDGRVEFVQRANMQTTRESSQLLTRELAAKGSGEAPEIPVNEPVPSPMTWREFEDVARKRMSEYYQSTLHERQPPGFPKRFDMVSDDLTIVGDAKYLTLVQGKKRPPAKFMEIAGHVWLLERLEAKQRFLVFGNQKRVIEWWLEKYGHLTRAIRFFFLHPDGTLEHLPAHLPSLST